MYLDAIAEALTIVTQKLANCNRQHDGLPPKPPCDGCYAFYCPNEGESHIDGNCLQCTEYWSKIYICLNAETNYLHGETKSLTNLVKKLRW